MKNNAILSNYCKVLGLYIILPFLAVPQVYCQTEITLKELVTNSSDIVVVRVNSIMSHWNNNHDRIFSEIELQVNNQLKGELKNGDKFKMICLGGHIDGITTIVIGMPAFTVEEESILFLEKQDSYNNYAVTGFCQGKFNIILDQFSKKRVVREELNIPLAVEEKGLTLVFEREDAIGIPLDEFIELIKSVN